MYVDNWSNFFSKRLFSLYDIDSDKKIKLSIDIKNVGNFDATETVQCFIRACKSSMTRPIKELKGFSKLFISKGECKTAEFEFMRGCGHVKYVRTDVFLTCYKHIKARFHTRCFSLKK